MSDDGGHGGFSEPRGAVEQGVFQAFFAFFGGIQKDLEVLLELGLSNVFLQGFWAEGIFKGIRLSRSGAGNAVVFGFVVGGLDGHGRGHWILIVDPSGPN